MQDSRSPTPEKMTYRVERAGVGKQLERTRSRVTFFKDKSCHVFYPGNECFGGINGVVREFVSDSGERLAVKAPRVEGVAKPTVDRTIVTLCKSYIEQIQNEADKLKAAYPADISEVLFLGQKDNYYSCRHVKSYREGCTLQHFIEKNIATSFDDLLLLCVQMIDELARIHNLGILHGDIKWDNIMVSKVNPEADAKDDLFKIYFIDFSLAYSLTDKKIALFSKEVRYFAPERCDPTSEKKEIAPHPAQDVSSFLYILRVVIETVQRRDFFPQNNEAIRELIDYLILSRTIDPNKRPTLTQLKEKINSFRHQPACGVGLSR